ncbi:trimethylamine methyltransferase family protein [Defluviimonas sp. WL0024]|uniref:Methyltransferase n=1 Tax=Albidovulum salinarum TaxID=2984153 RepID=A0ABT2X0M7_9RHOB|nr:trimethylamine methyltransferase family protein [Defluviimonas sp. WL0024]MCU9846577.1 trimethylamine methyltransferase family protein [Defluviimonas sp. WL0024]
MASAPGRSDRQVGGRSRRRGSPASQPCSAPAYFTRKIPAYELLGEEGLVRLEEQADWILKEVGIRIIDDPATLDLLRQVGATVDGTRVRFDPGHVRSLCRTAPSEFTIHARNPARDVRIGGMNVVTAPTFGPPMVTDLDRGRRKGSIEDFRNFVKLGHVSPWIHHSGGSVCEPEDLPLNKRHLDMVEALVTLSDKPFCGTSSAPERALDSLKMAEIAFGAGRMARDCVVMAVVNVNSPLSFDHITTGVMKAFAEAGQATLMSPFMMAGAMSPVTQPAAIAQVHAECMAGIALYQIFRQGAPIVYGSFLTTLDLRTGAPTYGTPEANLSTFATCQLARRVGVPIRAGGRYTGSKAPDAQAMMESVNALNAGIMAGTNLILHAAGWIEGGMATSYEKYVMDLDHIGALGRQMQGLVLDDNQMGRDAYRETALGENFLGVDHTQRNFKAANYMSDLADTGPYEHWAEKGSLDMARRANRKWKDMLAAYERPPIDAAVAEEVAAFVARRKSEMPDEWY